MRHSPLLSLRRAVRMLGCSVAVAGLGTSLALAQTTWFVSQGGEPGVDFSSIQAAVNAASPLDRIVVFEGSYSFFVADKPLEILAATPDVELVVDVNGLSAVTIENLAAGEVFVLHGFRGFAALVTRPVRVLNCAGTVLLEGLRNTGIEVVASADVRVVDTVLGHITAASNSRILLERVSTIALPLALSQLGIDHSEVLVVDSSIRGAGPMGVAFPGVVMTQGDLVAVDSILGAGGSAPASLATIDGTGTATLSGTTLLTAAGLPPVAPGVTVANRDITRLGTSGAVPGGTVEVELHGAPSALFATLIGIPTTPFDIGFADDLWVQPILSGPGGALDANGDAAFSVPVPFDLALLGLPIAWQGATLTSSSFELTTPSTYVHALFVTPFF